MQYGVTLPPFADWSDPRVVMQMAADAEAAGWDGFFLWDHVTWDPNWGGTPPIADPYLCLAAAATVTSSVVLGPMITPLARRRPQIVARAIVTLDHLSGGRAVLGVGLGADIDYAAYGEPVSRRGARLDECLTVLTGLLGGEAVDFAGAHLQVHSPPSLPRPVNGSLPIWIGGWWPNRAPFARAARFDGVVPGKVGQERGETLTIDDLHAIRAAVGRDDGFDYVLSGRTDSPSDTDAVQQWESAGATWWLENLYPWGGVDAMQSRLRAGPPRL
jgi:alkanesulfonate monooxygenase SsuD/methylene tetrahydromethanopterin reductase-like flavin-dependent oxidoreductase (luciferase family)